VPNRHERFRRRSDAMAILSLVGLLAWFWSSRVMGRPQTFAFETFDLFVYFEPLHAAIGQALRHGRVPFWNPYQGFGEPLLAVLQGGVFYPARLLLLAFDPAKAMGWSALLHLAIGAVGMFAFVRALGASTWGASVASITFTYGFAAPGIYQPATYLDPGVWCPVAAFAIIRIVSSCRWRYVVLASVAMAAPIVAGGYQIPVYSVYALIAVGLGLLSDPNTRAAAFERGSLVRLLMAGVLAVALSSIQWAPTLLWANESVRSPNALSLFRVDPYHAPPMAVVEGLLGRRVRLNGMFLPSGLVALALVGAVFGPWLISSLMALALLSVCLSLGPSTPWFSLYYLVPGFSMFRAPVRLHYLVVFGAAVAAGFGLDALTKLARPRSPLQSTLVAATIAAALVAVLHAPAAGNNDLPTPKLDRYDLLAAGATLAAGLMSPPLVAPAITAAVSSALIGERTNHALLPYSALGVSLLAQHQMTYRALAAHARLWRTLFVTPGLTSLSPAFALKQAMLSGLYAPDDYEPLAQGRLMDYLSILAYGHPLEDRDAGAGSVKLEKPLAVPRLLDIASVRFIVVAGAPPSLEVDAMLERYKPLPRVVAPADGRDLRVLENPAALPRAYVVTSIRHARDDNEAMALMKDPEVDLEREVVGIAADQLESGGRGALRAASITSYEPERVVITAQSDGVGVLVLTDTYAPGWEATVDGEQVRVWRANYLFRGVTVPPGKHEVVFTYVAPGYRFGATASAMAIAVLGGTPVALWLTRRRRRLDHGPGRVQL
jgi:hypothetical protein